MRKIIYTCDRCGAKMADSCTTHDIVPYQVVMSKTTINFIIADETKASYLCDTCYKDFKKFMKNLC